MKGFLNVLGATASVIALLVDIVQLLALPVLFVVIGYLNSYSWQYYLMSVGGYFVLCILIYLVVRMVCRVFDKKFSFLTERILDEIICLISKKD